MSNFTRQDHSNCLTNKTYNMKTKIFFRLLLIAVLTIGICSSADAQLKGVLNKAKKAVKDKTEKTTDNSSTGNKTKTTKTTQIEARSSQEETPETKTYPSGPEIPQLMAMNESYSEYDETGQYINSLAWGLRKASQSEVKALAEKLTARFKWDRTILAQLDANEDYEFGQQLIKEMKNWQSFYITLGEIMNLISFAQFQKDESNGLWYTEGCPLMMCGMFKAGVPASEEGVKGVGRISFARKNGKGFFCDVKLEPVFAEENELEVAKLDLNMATNISNLFEGYPLEWCRQTQQGVMQDQFDIYYHKAHYYANALKEAISGNSLDNLEFKPMPKAGSMNASMNAKALAAEKTKSHKDVVKVVVTSNSWEVQKNPAGIPIRRVIYGYSVGNTKHGKMATKVSWAEDYQGGKYGSLHCYGVGTESFYVK